MSLVVMSLIGFCAQADVYCRFDPTAVPISFVEVDVKNNIGYTLTGWPEKRTDHKEMIVQDRVNGFDITFFGDVPLISANYSPAATLSFEQNEFRYPFEAYWNPSVPGGPSREARRGVCWTDRLQKTYINRFRTGG